MRSRRETALLWPHEQPELTDGTVVLRALCAANVDDIFALCQDAEIQRRTRVPSPYTRADAISAVTQGRVQWEERSGVRFVATAVDGALIGTCGLPYLDLDARVAEAGYGVAAWARGRGSARRMLKLMSDWALDEVGFSNIELLIEPANITSVSVAKKCGFTESGEIREELIGGQVQTALVFVRKG